MPSGHPLATLGGALGGIQLSGKYVPDLFFSGPAAGAEVTAATLLDDAIESVSSLPGARATTTRANRRVTPLALSPAITDWFVRANFPGLPPDAATLSSVCAGFGLDVREVTAAIGDCRWLRVSRCTRERIADAEARLHETHRIRCFSIRAMMTP